MAGCARDLVLSEPADTDAKSDAIAKLQLEFEGATEVRLS
jgi:hypothetical protein